VHAHAHTHNVTAFINLSNIQILLYVTFFEAVTTLNVYFVYAVCKWHVSTFGTIIEDCM
jgi:hypothetical protein